MRFNGVSANCSKKTGLQRPMALRIGDALPEISNGKLKIKQPHPHILP
jgi:hypothetical protein